MRSYLRARRGVIALLILFGGIFAAVFSLYDLPMEPIRYSLALCGAAGAAAAIADFVHYRRRLRELRRPAESFDMQRLPAPDDGVEAEYQRLLAEMERANRALADRRESDRRELNDYYTLWAHQIKTPIAAMRLLLQSDADRSEMEDELFHIERYVEMVLGYLRSESLSGDLLLRRCELDGVVRQCVRKYRRQFIRRHVALKYEPLNVTVLTDEKWLGFVVEQILSNALKYAPRGEVSIHMDAAEPMALVIEDNGVGIRPEDLPRVFEKGYTGFNGREGDRRSTGIGLYLCRRILTRLGHDISIQSAPGRGTRVTIRLDSAEIGME